MSEQEAVVRAALREGWTLRWTGYKWEVTSPDCVIRGSGRTPLEALAGAADGLWCTIAGTLT